MGLDIVELVLAVENRFQTHFSDDDLWRVVTVGDFYELVRTQVPSRPTKHCLTSRAFWRLRRGLMEQFGVERKRVVPSCPME